MKKLLAEYSSLVMLL